MKVKVTFILNNNSATHFSDKSLVLTCNVTNNNEISCIVGTWNLRRDIIIDILLLLIPNTKVHAH